MARTFYVFVYGTLKPGERSFATFCEPYLRHQRAAIAPGRLYHLPVGYPAMTLEAGWVRGALLEFSSPAVFDRMDAFEDYYPDRPQDSEYIRIRRAIFRPDQSPLAEAWVYVITRDRVEQFGGQWLPDGLWTERQNTARTQ